VDTGSRQENASDKTRLIRAFRRNEKLSPDRHIQKRERTRRSRFFVDQNRDLANFQVAASKSQRAAANDASAAVGMKN